MHVCVIFLSIYKHRFLLYVGLSTQDTTCKAEQGLLSCINSTPSL